MKGFYLSLFRFSITAIVLAAALNALSYTNENAPNNTTNAETQQSTAGETDGIIPQEGIKPDNLTQQENITIVMAGDLLMHRFVQLSGRRSDGTYNFDHLFENVKDIISSADIAIINQETPLAGVRFGLSGYPLFNAPSEVADAVANAGFDVVLLATNHALDRGYEGLFACIDYWQNNFPAVILAGCAKTAADAAELCIVERHGIRVAILNYTYGTNGIPLPDGMPWVVSLLDETRVRHDITFAREAADVVVVCPHWGVEYSHTPSAEQRRWCEIFLECGVDIVIGTHPHVVQPVEWYKRDDGHRMLVYYSLGNYVNSTADKGCGVSARMLGGIAKITLTRKSDGSVAISDASVIPIVTQLKHGYAGVSVYPFSEYTAELAESNTLVKDRDPLFSYEYCRSVFYEVFGNILPVATGKDKAISPAKEGAEFQKTRLPALLQ